jgi:hypothetical protein
MKKLLFAVSLLLTPFFLAAPVSAHFYQDSGPLQIQLHVLPDDAPKTLESATLQFSVYEGDSPFDLSNCTCKIIVAKSGVNQAEIAMKKQWLLQPQTVNVPYTFPAVGIYDIYFKGAPKQGSSFKDFSVSYLFRVDQRTTNRFLLYQKQLLVGGLSLIFATSFLAWRLEKSYQKTKKRTER